MSSPTSVGGFSTGASGSTTVKIEGRGAVQFDHPSVISSIVQQQRSGGMTRKELLVVFIGSFIHRLSAAVMKQAECLRRDLKDAFDGTTGSVAGNDARSVCKGCHVRILLTQAEDNIPFYLENRVVCGTPVMLMYVGARRVIFKLEGRRESDLLLATNNVIGGAVIGHLTRRSMEAVIGYVTGLLSSGEMRTMIVDEDGDSDYDDSNDSEVEELRAVTVPLPNSLLNSL